MTHICFSSMLLQINQAVLSFSNKQPISISSNPSLDTMAAVVPKILTVMKAHGTSLSVQLEALRAILHFVVPGESRNGSALRGSHLKGILHFHDTLFSRPSLKNQILTTAHAGLSAKPEIKFMRKNDVDELIRLFSTSFT